MKKTRFFSLLLALSLGLGLVLPVPALAIPDMEIAGTAAILVDDDHGEVLYAQQAHERRWPASITKVMTALLVLEAVDRGELSLTQPITASETMEQGLSRDGSTQNIKPGETLTVEQLLYCTLVASANEACNILAEAVAGDVASFVALMNDRAAALEMTGTHFVNSHGLHHEEHYTTAYDIYLMTSRAMENETFRTMVAAAEYRIDATDFYKARHFYNTNALLSNWNYIGYTYNRAIGVKTGSTPEAGQCLVSAAVEGGRTLIAVVLGAQNVTDEEGVLRRQSFIESKRLLQWGFAHFTRVAVLDETSLMGEVPVTLSQEANYVTVRPAGKLEATLPVDADPATFDRALDLVESVEAPVEKGQVLGTVTVSYEGQVLGTLALVSGSDVGRSELLYRIDRLQKFFGRRWVQIVLVVLLVLIAALCIYIGVIRKNRRRRRGRRGYAVGGYGRSRRKY